MNDNAPSRPSSPLRATSRSVRIIGRIEGDGRVVLTDPSWRSPAAARRPVLRLVQSDAGSE